MLKNKKKYWALLILICISIILMIVFFEIGEDLGKSMAN